MEFGHEKLDVYQLSLRYVAWANDLADRLKGQSRFARDQLLRASQSHQKTKPKTENNSPFSIKPIRVYRNKICAAGPRIV
jgi:hypothetical protein